MIGALKKNEKLYYEVILILDEKIKNSYDNYNNEIKSFKRLLY